MERKRKFPFIVLEGLDGSGKTTIAKLLEELIGVVHFNSVSGYYGKNREEVDRNFDPVERFLFYLAANRFASRRIEKLLESTSVICDRYFCSTLFYHCVRGVDTGMVDLERAGLLQPDFIFYLKVPFEELERRLAEREELSTGDKEYSDRRTMLLIEKMFVAYPGIEVIECRLRSPEEIVAEIVGRINERIEEGRVLVD